MPPLKIEESDSESWPSYRRYVVDKLETISALLLEMQKDRTQAKITAAVLGFIGGAIPVAISLVALFYLMSQKK